MIMDDSLQHNDLGISGGHISPCLSSEVRSEMARAVKELEIAAKVAAERRKKSAKKIMSDNTCVYVLCIDCILYIYIYSYIIIVLTFVYVCAYIHP